MTESNVGFVEIAQSVLEARERLGAESELSTKDDGVVGANEFYARAAKLSDYLNVLFTWLRLARLAVMHGHKTWREFVSDENRYNLKDFSELADPIFKEWEERMLQPKPSTDSGPDGKYAEFIDSPLLKEIEVTEKLLDAAVDDVDKIADLKVREWKYRRTAVQRARRVLKEVSAEVRRDRAFRMELRERREARKRRRAQQG